jgi:diguanylate cyclase (GGDEF)-like protein
MLDFLDYKTLLASECMLAIVFTIVFVGLKRTFPQVRGAYPVALSFALVVPETIFMALGGHVLPVVSVLMANTLTLSSLIAMYEAVIQFTGGVNRRWLLWFMAFSSFSVVYYNTEVHRNLVPCIISVSLVMAAIRGFTAVALFQHSRRSTQRKALIYFGLFLTAMGAISLRLVWNVYRHGLPDGMTEMSAEQAMMRATGMFYLATSGLCFLVLTSRELVSRRRGEEHQDGLTGTFNRGGLDLNLAIEMERSSRTGHVFSIALVQVDQLSRILEAEGRPAGNATLREVAQAISGQLRGTDHVGRYSGDLFLLVLSQTSQQEALIVAERVAGEAGKLKLMTDSHSITLSVGITESAAGDTGPQMISRAERAMILAGTEGGNCRRVVLAERAGAVPAAGDERVSAVA